MSSLDELILTINSYIKFDQESKQTLLEEWKQVVVPKAKSKEDEKCGN